MFIKVHNYYSNGVYYINVSNINRFYNFLIRDNLVTMIEINPDISFEAKETPEEILNLIKGSYLNV